MSLAREETSAGQILTGGRQEYAYVKFWCLYSSETSVHWLIPTLTRAFPILQVTTSKVMDVCNIEIYTVGDFY